MTIERIVKRIAKIKKNIIYRIQKKICDLLYRRITYLPDKSIWISTVIFPKRITFSDGEDEATICGVTDIFKGDENKVDLIPIYTQYINKRSDAKAIHLSVVEEMKTGYIAILG